jgi:thiol:disulfide interchange protein DsbC
MKRYIVAAAVFFATALPLANAADSKEEAAVRAAVLKLVPNTKIDAVEKSPINGYYQVLIGSQLVYVSADGRYVLQGNLYDADAKVDMTAARMSRVNVEKLEAYPAEQRITFAPTGKPKYKITVFTDIDCGYCRKMHQHIAEYNERGIQVDYLFFPRSGPNTPSFDKAVSVWCAKDRKAAFTSAKAGQDPAPLKCDNPINDEFQLGIAVGVDGTPAVYAQDGSKIGGYLTPDQLQAQLERIAASSAKSGS